MPANLDTFHLATEPMLKRFKLPLIIIAGLLLALLSLHLIVKVWITPVMEALFTESVSYYSSGLYTVTYDDMDVKPLQQKVAFQNFHLAFDSSRVQRTDSLRLHKWVDLQLDEFEIELENFWTMVPGRYLKVNHLLIENPSLKVYDFSPRHQPKKLDWQTISHFDAHQLIRDYFDSLDVNLLSIRDARLNWEKSDRENSFGLGGINATVRHLRIDSSTVHQYFGYPRAEQFEVRLRDASFLSPDSLYAFHLEELVADPVHQRLSVRGFSMEPQKPLYQFAHAVGHQVSRVDLWVEELNFQEIDLHYLVSEQAFLVGKIEVKKPEVSVFKDKRLKPPKGTFKPLLQETLHRIPVAFRLDTLQLSEGKISYQEHVEEATEAGGIRFDDLYVSGYNITNVDSLWEKELLMEADIETRFMEESRLQLALDVPLNSPSSYHRLQGEIREMPLNSVNNMLENTAFASIESGHAYTLRFDMRLDEQASEGDLQFAYRDLKIRLLDKESSEKGNFKKELHSLLANWLVVKTNNPDNHRKPLRVGEIRYTRDAEKSIFNYWWKSLLSGIKGSVGMGDYHSSARNDSEEKEKKGLFKKIFRRDQSDS